MLAGLATESNNLLVEHPLIHEVYFETEESDEEDGYYVQTTDNMTKL